jgi:hypothetical protein
LSLEAPPFFPGGTLGRPKTVRWSDNSDISDFDSEAGSARPPWPSYLDAVRRDSSALCGCSSWREYSAAILCCRSAAGRAHADVRGMTTIKAHEGKMLEKAMALGSGFFGRGSATLLACAPSWCRGRPLLALVARVGTAVGSTGATLCSSMAYPYATMSTRVRRTPFLIVCGCWCSSVSARGTVSRPPTSMAGGRFCHAEWMRRHTWLAQGLRLLQFHRNWLGAASTAWVPTMLPPLAAIGLGASGVGRRVTMHVNAGVNEVWSVDNLDVGLMVPPALPP